MVQTNTRTWDSMWIEHEAETPNATAAQDNGPTTWEATINNRLAQMLESPDSVERAIAARLLLAESYLGRLYREGADDVLFAPTQDGE